MNLTNGKNCLVLHGRWRCRFGCRRCRFGHCLLHDAVNLAVAQISTDFIRVGQTIERSNLHPVPRRIFDFYIFNMGLYFQRGQFFLHLDRVLRVGKRTRLEQILPSLWSFALALLLLEALDFALRNNRFLFRQYLVERKSRLRRFHHGGIGFLAWLLAFLCRGFAGLFGSRLRWRV